MSFRENLREVSVIYPRFFHFFSQNWRVIQGICRSQSITGHNIHCVVVVVDTVGTNGVSQNHLLSFDDNKILKIINWIC